ncbi:THUMP domain-containing protein [Euphorbia peplus]|nr:THUMP domain-containing protein [Euphorbia peplus]
MGGENNPSSNSKKRKQHYRPNNKAVKKKGAYPLRPGVQGFFITCDGGRERQASHEAINVIDFFYEELIHGKDKPLNKKTKFVYSDEEEDGDDDGDAANNDAEEVGKGEKNAVTKHTDDAKAENVGNEKLDDPITENACHTEHSDDAKAETVENEKLDDPITENACHGDQTEENNNDKDENGKDPENETKEVKEPPAKKQCAEACVPNPVAHVEQKSIDQLIEDELKELGDKSKRRFFSLDSGCNGVVFIQMRMGNGDPSPKDIAHYMMTSLASSKKHMSRFILRVLPVEVSCYSSEEEISKAMVPIVEKHFPSDSPDPHKFAVLYEARANSGIDRMKTINAVAKSVPEPHKVDLTKPDKTIVVEIVKTVCLIGVVEKYKELAKYNLRQLTAPPQ